LGELHRSHSSMINLLRNSIVGYPRPSAETTVNPISKWRRSDAFTEFAQSFDTPTGRIADNQCRVDRTDRNIGSLDADWPLQEPDRRPPDRSLGRRRLAAARQCAQKADARLGHDFSGASAGFQTSEAPPVLRRPRSALTTTAVNIALPPR